MCLCGYRPLPLCICSSIGNRFCPFFFIASLMCVYVCVCVSVCVRSCVLCVCVYSHACVSVADIVSCEVLAAELVLTRRLMGSFVSASALPPPELDFRVNVLQMALDTLVSPAFFCHVCVTNKVYVPCAYDISRVQR